MNKYFFLLASIIFFSALSCKDKEEIDLGFDYYPIETGDYKIYNVLKITYEANDTIIENYQIKEWVSEIFTINGEERYKMERYKRLSDTLSWPATPDSVWSASVNSSRIIKVENNVRLVKLVFPVESGKTWDGNSENDRGEEVYTYKDVNKPYTLSSQTYDKTATVIQNKDTTFINKDYRWEIYAKGVGMIYRLKEVYEFKQTGPPGKIESGIKYYESLSSYGK
ncbi:MAG: hypothetical protein K2X86_07100 [Cytophagaceae bacterium]|nr:hypothetical protein [Cytophagaceae bacterium]